MKQLIYIPVIQTKGDMASLEQVCRRQDSEQAGLADWGANSDAFDRSWNYIRKHIETMNLAYSRVRLYQEGFSQSGNEVRIASDLARTGSRNHQLLLYLAQKGATLMGPESPNLLLEDYLLIRQVQDAQIWEEAEQVRIRQQPLIYALHKRRDRYIAEYINKTLGEDETGILFLGLVHSVEEYISKNIQWRSPIFAPSEAEDRDVHEK